MPGGHTTGASDESGHSRPHGRGAFYPNYDLERPRFFFRKNVRVRDGYASGLIWARNREGRGSCRARSRRAGVSIL